MAGDSTDSGRGRSFKRVGSQSTSLKNFLGHSRSTMTANCGTF